MNESSAIATPPTPAQPAVTFCPPPRFQLLLLMVIWLIAILATFFITFFLPEWFSSTTRIKVERDRTDRPGIAETATAAPPDQLFLNTQCGIIKSELVLTSVVVNLKLSKVWGEKYNGGSALKYGEAAAIMKAQMAVRVVPDTTLIDIQVYDESPTHAALYANEIAKVYRNTRWEQARCAVRDKLIYLEKQLSQLEHSVGRVRKQIAAENRPAEADEPLTARTGINTPQQDLEQMLQLAAKLKQEMHYERRDYDLSRNEQVQIVESAMPAHRPEYPRMAVNLILGAGCGLVIATILTTLIYVLQRRAHRLLLGRPPQFNRLRSLLRVCIGISVAAVVGYNCSVPLDRSGFMLMGLAVVFAGLAMAIVELRQPTELPPKNQQAPQA